MLLIIKYPQQTQSQAISTKVYIYIEACADVIHQPTTKQLPTHIPRSMWDSIPLRGLSHIYIGWNIRCSRALF